jgi:hypothetical protein
MQKWNFRWEGGERVEIEGRDEVKGTLEERYGGLAKRREAQI